MSQGSALVVPPSTGGGGGMLAGMVSGPLLANVINPHVITNTMLVVQTITGGPGGGIAPATITSFNLAPGTIVPSSLSASALPFNNQLTNPGFNYVQLYNPAVATTIPDNTVGPDAWKVTRETAGVTYQRMSNAGLGNYTSANRARFTKTVAAGKVMVYQPLESLISLGFNNQPAIWTIKFNLSAANPIRIGFFIYTGGAPNSVVPPPVAAWNGNGVAPTLNAGFNLVGSFVTGSGVGQSQWAVTFGIPTIGANDILCVFAVTDNQMLVGQFFDMYETELDVGDSGGRFLWKALPETDDIARVQRFIEKSYDMNVAPATLTLINSRAFMQVGAASLFSLPFRQEKIVNGGPAVTFYSPVTGATGNFADITTIADVAVGNSDAGKESLNITSAAAADNDILKGHWLINGSL